MPASERFSPLGSAPGARAESCRSGSVTVREVPFCGKLAVRGHLSDRRFSEAVENAIGSPPPDPGGAAVCGEAVVLWLGPTELLAVFRQNRSLAKSLIERLQDEFAGGHGYVVDVGSATTILRVAGDGSCTLLRRFCAFPVEKLSEGGVARTRAGRIAILVHRRGHCEFDLYIQRSYALSFFEQIRDALASLHSAPGPAVDGTVGEEDEA